MERNKKELVQGLGENPLLVYHLDRKEIVWIRRDGYYPDINRMVNLERIIDNSERKG